MYSAPLKKEQRALLGALANCQPGKGRVVGRPNDWMIRAFSMCKDLGWVESAQFGSILVWKLTPSGRTAYHIALAEDFPPSLEC